MNHAHPAFLPVQTLLPLLAVLLLTLAPHAAHLPLWESAGIAGLLLWRAHAARRHWSLPPGAVKTALTLLAVIGVVVSFRGRLSGQYAGTALLCAMAALKLLELKQRRDVMVLLFLMYFLVLTHFLFNQDLWTLAYLLACVIGTTAVLIQSHHSTALSLGYALKTSTRMVIQALPLMVLLFVLFPRIPGPLWGLPNDAGAARSGLSDDMSPGDISSLINSDEVAFRVRFKDRVPPPSARYWRGPVLDQFDGRRWHARTQQPFAQAIPEIALHGTPLYYTITLEPQRSRWLLALDMPEAGSIPADAQLAASATLLAKNPVIDRRRYTLGSSPDYRLDAARAPAPALVALPPNLNPRTRAFAQQLRAQYASDVDLVNAALQHFRSEPFYYTLRPPLLGRNSVDEFLFDTRRGFCEHYASAMTVLMRAAGIAARVVTGYQGAERNALGDYWIVRQSDAHAWVEVWLAQRGWVRIDPTAAVAPERIESGLESALGLGERLPRHLLARTPWQHYIAVRWDWVNAQWNAAVLGYGPELQQAFLRRFGLDDLRRILLALTLSMTAVLTILGLWILYRQQKPAVQDRAARLWQRLQKRLARAGFTAQPHEGAQDFILRVNRARPQWADALTDALQAYQACRYGTLDPAQGDDDPAQLLRALRAALDKATSSVG